MLFPLFCMMLARVQGSYLWHTQSQVYFGAVLKMVQCSIFSRGRGGGLVRASPIPQGCLIGARLPAASSAHSFLAFSAFLAEADAAGPFWAV